MFPPHLDYLKDKEIAWFNPCNGLYGFWKELEKLKDRGVDFRLAWSGRDMKRAKEIYAASMAALALKETETPGQQWWIAKPKQDPPDAVIGTVTEVPGKGNLMSVREIEVVEHLSGSLLDTLEKKLAGKRYEPNTILVCLFSDGGFIDFKKISAEVLQKNLSLPNIFVVAHGGLKMAPNMSEEEIREGILQLGIIQLAPVFRHIQISPIKVCADWLAGKEGNFLQFQGRGLKPGLTKITNPNPPRLF